MDEFEIAPRRLVDGKRRAGRFARRHRQRRAFADLRAFDIGDRRRRRRQFEARKRAERAAVVSRIGLWEVKHHTLFLPERPRLDNFSALGMPAPGNDREAKDVFAHELDGIFVL